ncbi:MAG: RIP metalloprotease RseP [Desulfobacteraceae bacterium]|jgi:regulator of sigma E protease
MDILTNFFQNTGHLLFIYIIPFVIVLGIMIFFHELGHFLAAKFFNVKVLKFALGFGPRIVARKVGETEYSIRYLPLGGFVKMLGEDDFGEDSDPVDENDARRAFNFQHPLKRIAIVAAGPVFNLILAFLLYFGLYSFYGYDAGTNEIGGVVEGYPAKEAGLMKGDVILKIGENDVEKWEDIRPIVESYAGSQVVISVKRGDELLSFSLIPREEVVKNVFDEDIKTAAIGVTETGKTQHVRLSLLDAFKEAFRMTWIWMKRICLVMVKLFQGSVSIKEVGGPIMIGQMTGQIVQESVGYLIPFMAVISINLGLLNLLPIPILDGGVILFLLYELAMRKPISINKREFAMKIGLSLLLLLMAVVFYNDILRLFTK